MESYWIIDQPDELASFCHELATAEAIAVDTESDHFQAYFGQVCLIQLASPDQVALVDPLNMSNVDLDPLFDLLTDPGVVKLMHAGRNDILEFDRDFGIHLTNYFDTQVAASFLSYDRLSLEWLMQELLGVEAPPAFSRFDWAKRPLPEGALRYAAADVEYLHELRDKLVDELGDWYEPCLQHCAFIVDTVRFVESPFDPEDWRKMKSAKDLDPPARSAARELFILRHEICADTNIAPVHLFDNWTLARVAKIRPSSTRELARVRGVSDDLIKFWGDRIVAAIEHSKSLEPPPERPPRTRGGPRMSPAQKARYGRLTEWRDAAAEELGIPRELTFTNSTLRELACTPPEDLEALAQVEAVLPWHVERLGDALLDEL